MYATGENVRNDDTYTTRHKRCRSPTLNKQVSTRNVRKTGTTSSITSRTTTCPMSHHTCHLVCYCSASQCSQTTTLRTSCTSERPNRAKEHSSRDGDEHNMHDEKITPLAMCVTTRLPLPECTKEHSSRDSVEHNMHDEISHRSPCVLPLDCPYPSVPKNTQAGTVTNTTSTTKRSHRSPCVLPLDCPYPSVPKNTQAGTMTNTTCTTKDHTARDCTKEHSSQDSDEHNMHDERSHRSPCVFNRSLLPPKCAKEHLSENSDEHNMNDEKITPPAMCAYRSLLPSKCTKEHPSENRDEHTMTTKRSHRPPCVLTAHCPRRSAPKNTSERTVTNTT
ncbi:hypothetical protein Bbelb_198490 [Branchiostoma belcheri]|nr:hypothetical protein Bbelb_198490 [Branchiostoma belcheri]